MGSAGRSMASTTTCAPISSGRRATRAGTSSGSPTEYRGFTHHELDIRDRAGVLGSRRRSFDPDAVLHAAAQPSHDLAASRPFDDFDVNAGRHAEPAGGGPTVLPRVAVRVHVDEQGLRRRPEPDPLKELDDALGLRRPALRRRHRRETSPSISRSTRCSARRRWRPT